MYMLGYTLDNLSLMALTISTCFVVDDAIVVIENITRYLEAGDSPMQAALRGSREIGFTVLSMSTSLIGVFIPILLMGGIVGRLFREFAVTLSVAIAVSLCVSLTTTPMMCARFLKSEKDKKHAFGCPVQLPVFFVLFLFQESGGHPPPSCEGSKERNGNRHAQRDGELPEEPADDASHQKDGNKHGHQRNAHGQNGEANFAGTFQGRLHRGIPCFEVAGDVFDDDDGVVHDETRADRQSHKREVVDAVVQQVHHTECADDGQRH